MGLTNRVNLTTAATESMRLLPSAVIGFSIAAAIVVFVCGVVPSLFGFKTMVVPSGNMEPTISVGDAVMVKSVGGSGG